MPVEQALEHLQTQLEGLGDDEVDTRRLVKGPNVLPSQKPPSWLMTLLGAIPNPFNLLLIFLAVITAAVPPRDWV